MSARNPRVLADGSKESPELEKALQELVDSGAIERIYDREGNVRYGPAEKAGRE